MDVSADIRELLVAARGGAPDAIGRIFEAARGHLLQLAARELPAELRAKIGPSDLVQETAVDMHRDFAQFNGPSAEECSAWLRGILRHNAVDAVRHYRESLKRNAGLDVAGRFSGTVAFGSTSLTSQRETDTFIAKIGADVTLQSPGTPIAVSTGQTVTDATVRTGDDLIGPL